MDRELERRGHRFVRYADDSNIYVKSERAGQRVMESVKQFLTKKAQAQGERIEECGGTAQGSEVSWIQLHRGRIGKEAYRAPSDSSLQGANLES